MNEIIAKFIEEQKKKQKSELQKKKEKHLLNLGLVDDADSSKQYCSKDLLEWQRKEYGYIYQDEKGYFKYTGTPKPLNVSDEEYEEICKICPPKESEKIEIKEQNSQLLTARKWSFIITGVISLILGIVFVSKVEMNRYGGDAFTGIQNASALTALAVNILLIVVGAVLITIGATTCTKKS